MKENKNTDIWKKLSKHLDEKYKDFVVEIFDGCFSYSVPQPWDKIIADLIRVIESHVSYKGTNIKMEVCVKGTF